MDISLTLTYGKDQSIDGTVSDDQPYSPDVADDLASRAVTALLSTWRSIINEPAG